MLSTNLTNPDNPNAELSTRKYSPIVFKERVASQLIKLNIPTQIAELAVIDLRAELFACHTGKLSPTQTANFILGEIENIYKNEQGQWHFGC